MKYYLLFFIFINITAYTPLSGHQVYIIVHGTWGFDSDWYQPGGDFFEAVKKFAHETAHVIPFSWSGNNSIDARSRAANSLASCIDSYHPDAEIIVIGHSHGGTVALLASHLITTNKISLLYTLGTPINRALYPNMDTIEYCYNLFSFEDLIQTVGGMFHREHELHTRIGNIRVVINGKEPDHSQLHSCVVGRWLPHLHTKIMNSKEKVHEPGVLFLHDFQAPVYQYDEEREKLLERDHQLSLMVLNSFRRSLDNESKIPLTKR